MSPSRKADSPSSRAEAGIKSEWPLSMLLDETWLRIRRTLVRRLEAEGLWIGTEEHDLAVRDQFKQGTLLDSTVLHSMLGPIDFASLNSEAIFGISSNLFQRRLPYVTSFGYDLGILFSTLYGGSGERTQEVASVTAMFNVGVSLFDILTDTEPEIFERNKAVLNAKTLDRLSHDRKACEEVRDEVAELKSVEFRILMKVIAWVFLQIHLTVGEDSPRTARRISNLMKEAYKAETLSSAQALALSPGRQAAISRRKSTMPFSIIHLIARGAFRNDRGREFEGFSLKVGEVFWLLDDLVDVFLDLEHDHLNAFTIQTWQRSRPKTLAQKYDALARLLESRLIEERVTLVCATFRQALALLRTSRVDNDRVDAARSFVASSVRNWID